MSIPEVLQASAALGPTRAPTSRIRIVLSQVQAPQWCNITIDSIGRFKEVAPVARTSSRQRGALSSKEAGFELIRSTGKWPSRLRKAMALEAQPQPIECQIDNRCRVKCE